MIQIGLEVRLDFLFESILHYEKSKIFISSSITFSILLWGLPSSTVASRVVTTRVFFLVVK
jgi:hypothetical protein